MSDSSLLSLLSLPISTANAFLLIDYIVVNKLQESEIIVKYGYSYTSILETKFYSIYNDEIKYYQLIETLLIAACDIKNFQIAHECYVLLCKKFNKKNIKIKYLEGIILEANCDYDGALEIYEEILNEDNSYSNAWKRKICIYKAQNDLSNAIVELNKYLDIYSNDELSYQELTFLYLEQCKYDNAKFCIEELLTISPENYIYHLQYADVLYTINGPNVLSRNYYSQALVLNPKCVRAMYGIIMSDDLKSEVSTIAMLALEKIYADAKSPLQNLVAPSLKNKN